MYEFSESPLFLILFGSFRQIPIVHNTAPQIQVHEQNENFSEDYTAEMCHICALHQLLNSKTPVKPSNFF